MKIETFAIRSICMRRQAFMKLCALFGAAVGIPALLARAIRHHAIPPLDFLSNTLNSDFVVYLEHLASGMGVPALASVVILFQMRDLTVREIERPHGRITRAFVQLLFHELTDVAVVTAAAAGYLFHSLEHELRQAMITGYWGQPRAAVQWEQLAFDFAGVAIFLLVARHIYRQPLISFWERLAFPEVRRAT